jgi:hypothetical protein
MIYINNFLIGEKRLSGIPNGGLFRVRLSERDYRCCRTNQIAGFGFSAKESFPQADGS